MNTYYLINTNTNERLVIENVDNREQAAKFVLGMSAKTANKRGWKITSRPTVSRIKV